MTDMTQVLERPVDLVASIGRFIWSPTETLESQTTTASLIEADIEASVQELPMPLVLLAWLGAKTRLGEATLPEELVVRYTQFAQVHSIYLRGSTRTTKVTILLDQKTYSDELMDQLLDEEAEILTRHPHKLFDFHYIPLLDGHSLSSISPDAILIWGKS